MKKLYLFLFLIFPMFTLSYATVVNVDVGDNFFSPVSFSISVGDTIIWTVSGFNPHTTTSTSVPVGATTWDYSFTGVGDSFTYIVTVAGVYEYECTIHSPLMDGSFSTDVPTPFIEDFDYTTNENLTLHGWVAHSGSGTQPQTVVTPGLTFTGYPSSGIGNAALLDNNGEDISRTFTPVTSGSVYMSFMVKVDAAATGYFIHYSSNPLSTANYRGRVWIEGSGTNLAFKLSFSTSDTTSTPYDYTTGVPYHVIVKYEITSGTLNDFVSLYIFSSTNPVTTTEPAVPTIGPIANGTVNADIEPGSVCLRQYNASQNITVDGIRIATSWSDVVPVELTSFNAIVKNNSISLNWTTATELNNSGFEIERKLGNPNWSKIAFVKGHGTSTIPNKYSYTDTKLSSGNYTYRLKQIDFDGSYKYSNIVEASIDFPSKYELSQNYPNPFNPNTVITYSLPKAGHVTLKIYNALGQEISTLVNRFVEAGNHNEKFNASGFSSGIYYYRLEADGFTAMKKMILIR
jgi:plastocyanin